MQAIGRALRIAAATTLAAAAGSALPSGDHAVRSLLEARHQNVVIQEWDSSCGAAALATILRYQLGDPVTERTVALGMLRVTDPDRVRGRGGFSLLDMKRYAERRGFTAEGYAGLTPGQLLRLAPAIVPVRSFGGDHFVVFRGVVRGQAVIADPAFGNRSLPFPAFQAIWKDQLAFAVTPPRGKRGNRLLATHRDLLRVEDDATRATLDTELPKPLADAQLALFAVATPAVPAVPPSTVESNPPGASPRLGDHSAAVSPPSLSATLPGSSAASTTTTPSTVTASTSTTSIAVSTPLAPTLSVTSPSVTSPSVGSLSVSSPLPLPGVTVSTPSLSLPIGR